MNTAIPVYLEELTEGEVIELQELVPRIALLEVRTTRAREHNPQSLQVGPTLSVVPKRVYPSFPRREWRSVRGM